MTLRRPFPRRGRAIATAAWPCDSGRLGHTADMKSLGSANRRRMMHLGALAFAIDLLAAPIPARAQAPKVFRIGWLGYALPANPEVRVLEDAFVEALRAQGFVEGQNVVIERRWTEGRPERAAASAAEFVQMKVDVIVAVGPGAFAAKQATGTIPIVMLAVAIPDRLGLVASLGRPGGNVTGVTNLIMESSDKMMQILKDLFPQRIRLAIVWDPNALASELALKEWNLPAAKALGMEVVALAVRSAADLESALDSVIRERAEVLFPHLALWAHRARIQDFAAKQRLPTATGAREWTQLGALFSYGPNTRDMFERSAVYVAKILRGAKPADLPVEQPTKFELVINMKTAKALGITVPYAVLLQATELIE